MKYSPRTGPSKLESSGILYGETLSNLSITMDSALLLNKSGPDFTGLSQLVCLPKESCRLPSFTPTRLSSTSKRFTAAFELDKGRVASAMAMACCTPKEQLGQPDG